MSQPSYRESRCSQETRNPDDLLTRFAYDRRAIIESLLHHPENFAKTLWTDQSPMSIDRACQFQLGMCPSGVCQTYFQCALCRSLNRFLDLRRQSYLNVPFELPSRLTRSPLILTRLLVPHPKLKLVPDSPTKNKLLLGDEFTHHVVVNFILESLLPVPHICSLHTAFICGDYGYFLYEFPTLGGLPELCSVGSLINSQSTPTTSRMADTSILKTAIIRQILLQLGATLHALLEYNFYHGAPSCRHWLFNQEPCDYTYDGVNIRSTFTLKLIHFANSTLTLPKTSLTLMPNHCVKTRETACQRLTRASPEQLEALFDGRYHLEDIPDTRTSLYRLTGATPEVESRLEAEAPSGSMDLYCYLIGLLSEPYTYPGMMELRQFWDVLFLPTELEELLDRLRFLHSRHPQASPKPSLDAEMTPKKTEPKLTLAPPLSYKELLALLKGKHLRCDAVDVFWQGLSREQ